MLIKMEMDLRNFQAWSGGENTLDRVIKEDKVELLESCIEELYPGGLTDTELNDLLWFDSDTVYEWCGMMTENQINDQIKQKEYEIMDLEDERNDNIMCTCALWSFDREMRKQRAHEIREDYNQQIEDVRAEIEELREML